MRTAIAVPFLKMMELRVDGIDGTLKMQSWLAI
jgi:hypothetical protein